jgi:hypothetical protein
LLAGEVNIFVLVISNFSFSCFESRPPFKDKEVRKEEKEWRFFLLLFREEYKLVPRQ